MKHQIEHAHLLKNLHIKGDPLILFNIWDAGSARAIQEIGAKVIATGSWSVAAAYGYDDGEKLPFDLALANLKRIVASVDLPVTFDLEGAYGHYPNEVQANVIKVIQAGAVGINFEDLPINIMMLPDLLGTKHLAELGVARISYGPSPYRQMIQALKEAGCKAFSMN